MTHKLYGWKLSYYTAKVFCYLKYKHIPFKEVTNNVIDLYYTIPKHTGGAKVMPVVLTPNGKWIQDTRNIIETLETQYPNPPVFPSMPRKRFISCILEAWADEFWVPIAMHYRWNYNESVVFFKEEAGDNLFPFAPKFVKSFLATKVANTLQSYLPIVGVRPSQFNLMEIWTEDMMSKLDLHFVSNSYLLGTIPSIGDFGLAGPFVAHLGRDPYPKNNLISKYPNVANWITRISSLSHVDINSTKVGDDSDDNNNTDNIPESLIPILDSILHEFIPLIEQTVIVTNKLKSNDKFIGPNRKRLPRNLEDIQFPMSNGVYSKNAMPFNLWKMQKVLDQYNKMTLTDQVSVQSYFIEKFPHFDSKQRLFNLKIPSLEREELRVKFVE
jgi:glutathione S-transferase